MLSLGCERLPTPLKKKEKKKRVLDHYLHHDLGMLPLLRCFFAHLLILQYPDHHQNLISSYLYYSGPVHKISSQSVQNFLCNVVHRQTDRQTNATKNITSFAKEVIINQIKRVIPCYKEHDTSFIWYYYTYHISKAILDLDPDFCRNFLFFLTLSILHIEACTIPLRKAVFKGLVSCCYT